MGLHNLTYTHLRLFIAFVWSAALAVTGLGIAEIPISSKIMERISQQKYRV